MEHLKNLGFGERLQVSTFLPIVEECFTNFEDRSFNFFPLAEREAWNRPSGEVSVTRLSSPMEITAATAVAFSAELLNSVLTTMRLACSTRSLWIVS